MTEIGASFIPWSRDQVDSNEVAAEVLQILDRQQQRARQQVSVNLDPMVDPAPLEFTLERMLAALECYFAGPRAVLWRHAMEALTEQYSPHHPPSVPFLAAKTVFGQLVPEGRDLVRRSLSDVQISDAWNQHRIAYMIHPGLAAALRDTDPAKSVPTEVLARLPHPDPAFLLLRGVPVVLADGQEGVMRAFFVRGLIDQMHCSTAHPDVDGFQICALTSIGLPGDPPSNWDLSAVTVRLYGEYTVEQAAGWASDRWDANEPTDPQALPAWTRQILEICLPLVLYCCAVNADVKEAPASAAAKRSKPKRAAERKEPTRVVRLGYRIGPALVSDPRKPVASTSGRYEVSLGSNAAGGGGAKRTHVRRAHWHTYRCGPGRADTKVRWIAPIVINPGGKPETTVVPVR